MRFGDEFEDLLGYQLRRAELRMDADARSVLASFDLTPAKTTAVLLVRANPGCDQSALGRALAINRSSVMKLINTLVALVLVERRQGRDLRSNALHLTPRGEAVAADALAALQASDARMSERLTAEERRQLARLLGKIGATRGRRAGAD